MKFKTPNDSYREKGLFYCDLSAPPRWNKLSPNSSLTFLDTKKTCFFATLFIII